MRCPKYPSSQIPLTPQPRSHGEAQEDLALFVDEWLCTDCAELSNNYCQEADLNRDGKVDLEDMTILTGNWLMAMEQQLNVRP